MSGGVGVRDLGSCCTGVGRGTGQRVSAVGERVAGLVRMSVVGTERSGVGG